jgi:hypothetical protein
MTQISKEVELLARCLCKSNYIREDDLAVPVIYGKFTTPSGERSFSSVSPEPIWKSYISQAEALLEDPRMQGVDKQNISRINRVVVIDENGIILERRDNYTNIDLSLQDNGRTLKIFLRLPKDYDY